MKKTRKQNRWLSFVLCLCLLAGVFPLSGITYAKETDCSHTHDETCGYTEGTAGQPCAFTHPHDEFCGYAAAAEGAPCAAEASHTHDETCGYTEGTAGQPCAFTHAHDEFCGYAAAAEGAPCAAEASHTHDETCGYIEGTAGQPCAHIHDAACGGLSPESGLTPCTKTEGCKLLAGHAGVCDALLLPALLAQNDAAANFALSAPSILTVKFDNNNSGGTSLNDNDMKTAVEDALLSSGKNKTDFTAIQLTGNAAEITGYNWKYLLELYKTGTGWSSLATMDLSTMASLTKVENEKDRYTTFSQLTAVQFPAGLQTIGSDAFHNCSGLQSVAFPTGLQTIGSDAFYNCIGLQSVTFPAGLQTIERDAFANCSNLTSVDLSACTSLQTIGWYAFGYCGSLTSVDLSFCTSLQTIGVNAFNECRSLQSVTLPASLQTLEPLAFSGCISLTAFSVDPSNRYFTSLEGVLYDKSMETLFWYPVSKSATSFTVPSTVKTIGIDAFNFSSGLQSVTLPAGLQTIGREAFMGCGLQSVTLPASLQTLENCAFISCSDLQNVDLSSCTNLQTIGAEAFANCSGLTSVDLSSCTGLQTIDRSAFDSCSGLQSVAFPTSLQTIGKWAFRDCSGLQSVAFPTSLQTIEAEAFANCSGLQSVTFPASLQSIGESAFDSCSGLTSIAFLGETPPRLGNNALAGVSANGTLYYPAKAAAAYTGGAFIPNGWAQKLLYTLTVNGGSDETGKLFYLEGTQVQIKAGAAPAGQVFDKWTALGGAFADAASPATTFTMPAADVTVTAAFKNNVDNPPAHSHTFGDWQRNTAGHWRACVCGEQIENTSHTFGSWVTDKKPTETAAGRRHRDCTICGYRQTGSIAPAEPVYKTRTLTDKASGVQVSGLFTSDAALEVKDVSLHAEGDCAVCDDIRQRQDKGELIALFDIALLSGKYTGELDVEIPVDEQYNGQTAVMLHCKDKVAESRTVAVSGGATKGTFSSLSPFAVAAEAGETVITGLPESAALTAGESVSWTPAPAGGVWRYDTNLLEMAQDGGTYTFKALKEGTAAAVYTVGGAAHTVTVTITVQPPATPQTDNDTPLWPWLLAALVTVALVACLGWLIIKRRKQSH